MKKKKDIKKLGIPNVCFSHSLPKDDERKKKFKKQRMERGFDNSELWSLSGTIAKFIIPRLEEFIEISNGVVLRTDKEKNDLQTMLSAFKLVVRDDESWSFSKEEEKVVHKGLKLFAKKYFSLWW